MQKREICLLKKNVPEPKKNIDLAKQFGISPGRVTDINYLQQGDIEINYDEFKAFRALKRKVELHSIAKQKQTRLDSFVTD